MHRFDSNFNLSVQSLSQSDLFHVSQFQSLEVQILSQNRVSLESDEHSKTTLKRFWPNFFKWMLAKLIHRHRFEFNFNLSKFEFCLKMAFFTKAVSAQKSLWSDFDQISSNECWQNWFTISQNSLFTFRWIPIPNLWASNSVSKRHFVKSKLHSKVIFNSF